MNNNILEILRKSRGYEIALFTSYTFEISFFEQYILKTMFSNGIKKISVFVDSKQYNKAVSTEGSVYNAGSLYPVNLLEMGKAKAFHPKVILLLGNNKARVFVSSCNLTSAGYLIQNEVFYCYDFDNNHCINRSLVLGVIDFFCRLNDLSRYKDDLFQRVKEFRAEYDVFPDIPGGPEFIHNLDVPMIEQISNSVNDAKRIEIAVPYYDDNCDAVRAISQTYNHAGIMLFLENRRARIQFSKLSDLTNVKSYPFSEIKERNRNFYHGKVFKFINGEDSFVVFGSANCTRNALLYSYQKGGNIEADVIQKTNTDDSIDFYDSFQKCSDEIQYDTSQSDKETKENFFFRYGQLCGELDDKIYLNFGFYEEPKDLIVSLNGDVCEYSLDKNSIIIILDEKWDIADNTIIFDFQYNGKTEKVIGWFIDPANIQRSRETNDKVSDITNIILDPTSSSFDKLLEDIDKVIGLVNINTYPKTQFKPDTLFPAPDETINGGVGDDGPFVDVVPPVFDENIHFPRIKKINIRGLTRDEIFGHIAGGWSSPPDIPAGAKDKPIVKPDPEGKEHQNGKPVSDKTKFKNAVNRRLKHIVKKEFAESAQFDIYIACVDSLLHLLEEEKEIFNNKATADYRLDMAMNTISLAADDTENIEKAKILFAYSVLANKCYVDVDDSTQLQLNAKANRVLFKFGDAKSEEFRKSLTSIVKELAECKFQYEVDDAGYLDELFGFLPLDRIKTNMKREFFAEVDSSIYEPKQREIEIKVTTTDIGKYINYAKSSTVLDLINYNRVYEAWDKIFLFVCLKEDLIDLRLGRNPLVMVKREYDLKNRKCIYWEKSRNDDWVKVKLTELF